MANNRHLIEFRDSILAVSRRVTELGMRVTILEQEMLDRGLAKAPFNPRKPICPRCGGKMEEEAPHAEGEITLYLCNRCNQTIDEYGNAK